MCRMREPAALTRLCGSESGACFVGPHSPWSPPLAPLWTLPGLPYRREMKMASMIALNLSSEPCRLYRESILMPSTDELFDHLDEVAHSLEVGHVVI
jgi:hypothetical protein